ncbi:MAG: energy transducer TonB [Bacteroidia bacterium]
MSYLINNQQNLNEVIFANRNKSYGAYAIRSAYGNTVFKSLAIMALGFGTFMSLAFYFSNRNNGPEKQVLPFIQDSIYVVEVDNTIKENKIEKTEITPSDPAAGKKSDGISTNIVDSTTIVTNTTQIENTVVSVNTGSTNTTEIPTTGGGTGPLTFSVTGTGGGGEIVEGYGVDSQPEFEGGLKALYQFVSKNVKYPAAAIGDGKSGTVYVKFVVDEKGKVGSLTLQNNVGYGLDEEALRVVGLIPNFKTPAKVNGKPVKVYYQLPIKFKYNF